MLSVEKWYLSIRMATGYVVLQSEYLLRLIATDPRSTTDAGASYIPAEYRRDDDPTLSEGVMSVDLGPSRTHVLASARDAFSRITGILSNGGSKRSTATRDELERSAIEPVPGQRRLLAHLPPAVISSDD
jgi:hypothetical protein